VFVADSAEEEFLYWDRTYVLADQLVWRGRSITIQNTVSEQFVALKSNSSNSVKETLCKTQSSGSIGTEPNIYVR
jgi:hypothetical protein